MNQQEAKKRLDEIRQTVRGEWRRLLPTICGNPIGKHDGEPMYICPICGAGQKHRNSGIVYNRKHGNLRCNYGECDFSGDIIDLWQKVNRGDYQQALRVLANEAGIADDIETLQKVAFTSSAAARDFAPVVKEKESGTDFSQYYRACMERMNAPEAVSYLAQRGLTVEGVRPYMVGYDPQADPAGNPGGILGYSAHPAKRIIIPTTKGHYVGRSIDPQTDAQYQKMNVKGGKPGIFNQKGMYAQDVQTVFVVEGAFDALSILECGASAVALNSTNQAGVLLDQLEEQPTAATLILCLDSDKAGQKATATLQEGLTRLGINHVCADICAWCKDPNEALVKDRSAFVAAIKAAQEKAAAAVQESGESALDAFLQSVAGERYRPYPTGIDALDKRLGGGMIKQQLVLLGAEPGAGKTALCTQLFESYAKRGQLCVYYNLEMSRDQMLARSLSRTAYYQGAILDSLTVLRGYRYTDEQRAAVAAAAATYRATIAPNMLYNPDDTGAGLDEILDSIERRAIRAEAQGRPAPFVCLDYLQLLTGREREDATEVLKRAVVGLKRYAIKHDSIVLCIMAQSRRANESKEASLSAGRDTSNLEYTADTQLQLMTDKNNENTRKLFVTKSRFSAPSLEHGIPLLFRGAQSMFEAIQEDSYISSKPVKRR